MSEKGDFYVRYYVGHRGKFGHEFMEFEFRSDGKMRYANNSNYKNDAMIKKEVTVSQSVVEEVKRIIEDSEVTKEDDKKWPEPDRVGRQELEVVMGDEHISFNCSKIGSLVDVQESDDPEGLRVYFVLDEIDICDWDLFISLLIRLDKANSLTITKQLDFGWCTEHQIEALSSSKEKITKHDNIYIVIKTDIY